MPGVHAMHCRHIGRLAEARGEAAPRPPAMIMDARRPEEPTETHVVLQPASLLARPRPRPYRPPGLRPPASLQPPALVRPLAT